MSSCTHLDQVEIAETPGDHFKETGHPISRSAERGEDWSWCYVDELMFRLSR